MKIVTLTLSALILVGCSSSKEQQGNSSYQDTADFSKNQGVGIESHDIEQMSDQLVKSLLKNKTLMNRDKSPRVIIDSAYIKNESNSRINKNILTDKLRINLNKESKGKLVFVSRENSSMVESERELKREGVVDAGTIRTTQAQAGADFRLTGRISSLDTIRSDSQERSRYHQITFELVDLELGTIIWSDIYEFQKSAQDNVIYR